MPAFHEEKPKPKTKNQRQKCVLKSKEHHFTLLYYSLEHFQYNYFYITTFLGSSKILGFRRT